VTPGDVVWSYAGVRPLYDDGASKAQEATRDYVLELDATTGKPPLLSVFGGKITTFRRLAEAALDKLSPHLPMGPSWTAAASLPGGDFAHDGAPGLVAALRAAKPWLSEATAARLVRCHGTAAARLLHDATGPEPPLAADLTAREAAWMVEREWARTADDILFRRTKLGLRASAPERQALADFLASHPLARAA
jgi:glycerol-3-phosphate dehydrogenase